MSLKRFAKDTAIYGIATVLPRIINILLLGLFTKNLSTGQFSEATDYWIFASLFNVILTYGMETSFFRFFTKLKNDKRVLNTAFTSILITSLVALSLLLIFKSQLSVFLNIKTTHLSFLIWITILDTLVVIPYAYLRVINRPVRFAFYKISNVLINLIVIVFLFVALPVFEQNNFLQKDLILAYFNSDSKVIFIFIANFFASLVTLLLFLPIILKINLSINKSLLKQLLTYGLPIMIAGLAYVINENIDKLMIKHFLDRNTMGAYSATYKIGAIMTLFITAFRLGAEPFFFSQSDKKDAKQKYAKILLLFTIAGAFFYVAIVANMDIIASIFIKQKEYYSTIAIVPVILLANFLLGIYFNLAIWYKLTDRTKFGMYFSVFGALVTLVFNYIMIPKIGFMAAAWATVAAYGSMAVASFAFGKQYYPINYNIKKILFYLFSSAVLSYVIFTNFYEDFLVKNSILAGYGLLIIFLERKKLSKV